MVFSKRMEGVREFLESSTVHGLTLISLARNNISRLFWILVVFCGFFAAGILIIKSFRNWKKYPIESTIQTFPINEVRFPTVIACPPKGKFDLLLHEMSPTRIRHLLLFLVKIIVPLK